MRRTPKNCNEETQTIECTDIGGGTYEVTITGADLAYWITSDDPLVRNNIPLTDGNGTVEITVDDALTYTACATKCGGCKRCCSFGLVCDPCACCEDGDELYPPPDGVPYGAWNCLIPAWTDSWACVDTYGLRPSGAQPWYWVNAENCEGVASPTPVECECFDLTTRQVVQYIQFEVTGTGTGTFDPYIPPDDEFPACDEADCPDFNGTYIVPCSGTDGPYGGLDLLCTTDIGGTNYDWYIYKWWTMKDGILYLRMGLISRLSGSGDPDPVPGDGFTEADWIGDDIDVQDRLDEREYYWNKSIVEGTDPCSGTEIDMYSCVDLTVDVNTELDSGLCNDPTVTISELLFT